MKDKFERFLTNWWLGLCSAWASREAGYSLVDWNVNSGLLNVTEAPNSSQNELNYYHVPKQYVLSSAISTELASQSLASIVSATLPFDNNEVYAVIKNETLFAVLKSDIEPIQLAARSQSIELAGLIFEHTQNTVQGAVRLDFSAPVTSVLSAKKFFSVLGIIALIVAAILWKYSDNQDRTIAQLRSQLAEPQPTAEQAEYETLSLSGTQPQHVIQALLALKNTISEDTNINQLLLQSGDSGLSVILDAESVNAASLLALFEQDPQFQNSEFVTAISSDARNEIERFRLKTDFFIKEKPPLNYTVSHD